VTADRACKGQVRGLTGGAAAGSGLRPASAGRAPVSYQQERRMLRDAIRPDPLWRIDFAFELTGLLNVDLLCSALDAIVRRHEVLRSRFFIDDEGRPVQELSSSYSPLCHVTTPSPEDRAGVEVLKNFFGQPFERSTGDVFHVVLLRHSAKHWTLAFSVDHLVCDRQSVAPLLRELSLLYNSLADEHTLPAPNQFRAYSSWQRALLASGEGQRLRKFWREYLAGTFTARAYFAERYSLGTACAEGEHSVADLVRHHRLANSVVGQASRLRREEGVTHYAFCLSALVLVLDAIVGRRDHVVLSPSAERRLPEFKDLIGSLAHVIAVRVRWQPGISLRALMRTSMLATFTSLAHSALPWPEVVRECTRKGAAYLGERPIVIYLDVGAAWAELPLQMSGLHVTQLPISTFRKDALDSGSSGFTLFVQDAHDSWRVRMIASGRTFDDGLADRVFLGYIHALERVAHNPDMPADDAREELRALLSDECHSGVAND
jgi:Condensation domain